MKGYIDERIYKTYYVHITEPLLYQAACLEVCVSCVYVCFRLLAQLRDMEEAFDGFFEKHHLKLQQYLQLLHYEMSFQQVCDD